MQNLFGLQQSEDGLSRLTQIYICLCTYFKYFYILYTQTCCRLVCMCVRVCVCVRASLHQSVFVIIYTRAMSKAQGSRDKNGSLILT